MKYLFISMLISVNAFANLKYTEADFIKKVAEEVKKKVDDIKNKSVADLTKEIIEKEETVKLRELELEKKEEQVQIHSKELEKKVKSFDTNQQSILGCVLKNEEEQKSRIAQQVEVISNMLPAKAAELLSVQEPEISVKILQLLDSKKASKIFNLMDKEVSARLQKQYLNMKR
jgi:flagellar motility protein MotE (MotC chaperone)